MKTRERLVRLASVVGLSILGTTVPAVNAARAEPVRKYTKNMGFQLPVRMDPRERASLKELQLYVRSGGVNGVWLINQREKPDKEFFVCRVPQDGEYWYRLVTVNAAGQMTPADLATTEPSLIVFVDTQAPVCEIKAVVATGGEIALQCDVHDANPDPTKTKLEFQAPDGHWVALPAHPSMAGCFQATDPAILKGPLRASACDRAGNSSVREFYVQPATPPAPTATPAAAATPVAPVTMPAPALPIATAPPMPMATTPVPLAPAVPVAPPVPAAPPAAVAPATTPSSAVTPPAPLTQAVASAAASTPSVESMSEKPIMPANLRVVGSKRISLTYPEFSPVPSRVAVWITSDQGHSWHYLCEDPDKLSPVEFDLPWEGMFGIRVTAAGPDGECKPPVKGDEPQFWIEVDVTRPSAALVSVRDISKEEPRTILISWSAADKNLKSEPVDLYYTTNPNAPYQLMAKDLKNDGSYHWHYPATLAGDLFIRLDVSDKAGNVTQCNNVQAPEAPATPAINNSPRSLP